MKSSRAVLLAGILLLIAEPAGAPSVQGQQEGRVRALALCDSADARLERGDLSGAEDLFRQALSLDAEFQRALIGMGRVRFEQPTRRGEALEFLDRAIDINPSDPAAHYWAGRVNLELAGSFVGRDNLVAAEREFETCITLDPSHPDAYYRLGWLLHNLVGDYAGAVRAYRTQLAATPSHREAALMVLRAEIDRGEWRAAISAAEEMLLRDPTDGDVYPYLAGAHWKAGEMDEAMEVFDRYFSVMEPRERELYLDMGLILTPEEMDHFARLDPNGRRTFWGRYWRTRDPDPKTEVNERLLEHYIRIAWARLEFGQDSFPWDARGTFYVRYGEPDYRSAQGMPVAWGMVDDDPTFLAKKKDFQEELGLPRSLIETSMFDSPVWDPPMGIEKHVVIAIAESIRAEQPMLTLQELWDMASADAERRALRASADATPERWVYADRGIDLTFEDYVNSGNFVVSGLRSRAVVEQMEERVPTISEEEEKIDWIDPMDSVVTFKAPDGQTAVEYAFALLPDEFGAFRSVSGTYATIDVEVALYTEGWEEVARASENARRLRTIPQVQIRGVPLFVDATRMTVAPGSYRLTTLLLDPETGKRSTAEELVELPDYSGSELMLSDILPAARIQEVPPGREGTFIRGNLEVLPLPGRALEVDQPLFIYYEIYNLKKDPIGATEYEITYAVSEAPEELGVAGRLFQGLRSLVGRGRRRAVLSSTIRQTGIRVDQPAWLEIDMGESPPDTYLLELTVNDTIGGTTARAALLFRTLPKLGAPPPE